VEVKSGHEPLEYRICALEELHCGVDNGRQIHKDRAYHDEVPCCHIGIHVGQSAQGVARSIGRTSKGCAVGIIGDPRQALGDGH
jgi:hypothetical protein